MTQRGLDDLLEPFKGKRAWLLPLSDERGHTFANNGDLLMHRVFFDICQGFDITFTESAAEADFIAIPPNGALLDRFRAPQIVRDRLRPHGDKPVVIFPSSAQFMQVDPSMMFENRTGPTLWILREPYSHDHLAKDWGDGLAKAGVVLALDHDVVVSGARFVTEHFPHRALGRLHNRSLLVARLGVESRDIRNDSPSIDTYEARAGSSVKRTLVAVSRSLPSPAVRPARRASTFRRIQAANAEVLSAVPRPVQERFDRRARLTATDISDVSLVSFDGYRDRVVAADLVVTNRLHVAIPAALLGKETHLVDSGYHKLRGIYEHSLRHLDNITFVTRS